ncbi:uncharacterized protein LOC117117688 [Anneissia japonica]|uniref:uncharacterized protein LOC117117688 n=1 Tax=Anneissia japonica TaxID=1529436 RepID=UPI0014254D73|nr:uncharacterized protein LOC117117688 [Anneissia japonica]
MGKLRSLNRFNSDIDVLVQWDKDKSKNVVSAKDLISPSKLKKGSKVSMLWGKEKWNGIIIEIESESSSSGSESDDVPIATYCNTHEGSRNSPKETRPSNEHRPASCDNFTCRKEVWAACPTCLCFLCYDHFTLSDKCNNHNSNFSQLTSNTPKFPTANEEETEVSLTTPSDVCRDEVMFPAPSSQPPTPEANFSFIPTIPLIHDVNEVDGEMMSLLLSTGPIPPLFSETEEVTYPVLSTAL